MILSLICCALLYSLAILSLPKVDETDFILKKILLFSFSVSMTLCLMEGRMMLLLGYLNDLSVADCELCLTKGLTFSSLTKNLTLL